MFSSLDFEYIFRDGKTTQVLQNGGGLSHPHPHPCHHSVDMLIHSFHPWFTLHGTFLARHLWPVFPPTSITYLHLSKDSQHTSLIPRENMKKMKPSQLSTPPNSRPLPTPSPSPSQGLLVPQLRGQSHDPLSIHHQAVPRPNHSLLPTKPVSFQQCQRLFRGVKYLMVYIKWQKTTQTKILNVDGCGIFLAITSSEMWTKFPIIDMIRFEVNDPSSQHHPLWLHGQDTVSLPANQKLCQVCALEKQSVWPNHPAWGLPSFETNGKIAMGDKYIINVS